MDKRKLIVNNSITTVDDESAKRMLISEEGIAGEPLFSFAEKNEALYGYKGNGEVIKFITDKEIDSKYVKKTEVAQSDWNEADTTNPAYIKNKPELGTASPKDVPVSGNASDDQVVLGNDTRLLPQDASDVVYDGEHISDFKGANVKESISELEAAIIDDEQATAAALNDLNNRINEVSNTTIETINEVKTNLEQTIIENEEVTSASLNDLNDRVNDLYDAKYTGEVNVSNTTGTPSGTVTIENDNASKKFTFNFSGIKGTDGVIGEDGLSAYDIAKKNGYTGTEEDWLKSLKGDKGDDGKAVTIRAKKSDCKIIDTDAYLEIDDKGTYNVWILRSGSGESGDYENVGPFAIKGDKGDTGSKGDKGDAGTAAGIASNHNASVDENIGKPSVTVTASGANTEKVFTFEFHNLKGEKGETGAKGEQGPKGDDGKAVTIRKSKSECTVVDSDAYIELDPVTGNYYVWILRSGSGETGKYDNVGPFAIKGDQGEKGATGASVDKVTASAITDSSTSRTGNKLTFSAGGTNIGTVDVWNGINGQSATITVNEPKTNTGASGTTANVKISEPSGSTSLNRILDFEFTIPRGDKGEKGDKGDTGPKGNDGTGITVKPSRAECKEDGDAYIEQDENSANYGHIMIFNTATSTFVDGGLVKGPKGKSISSVSYSGVTTSGGPNKMVVNYIDGDVPSQSEEFIIYNGKDGSPGATGASINHVAETSCTGKTHTITAYTSTDKSKPVGSFTVSDGDDGVGISSIDTKSGTSGNYDTTEVTINLTNGSSKAFTVYDGLDGHSPTISIGDNGNWYIDGDDTGSYSKGKAATVSIGKVSTSTGNADTLADVTITENGQSSITNSIWDFDFTIPRGENGSTPEYKNGEWYIDGSSVGKAVGDKGEGIKDISTSQTSNGVKVTFNGTEGSNFGSVEILSGKTPTIAIGANGNWYIDGDDTGSYSKGSDGESADITSATATATTVEYGSSATANVELGGTSLRRTLSFSFKIPKGKDGKDGTPADFASQEIGSGFGSILCGGSDLTEIVSSSASVDSRGNINASAFYEDSDENLKWFTGEIPVDFEQLKSIPKQYFIWRNRETPTNIGTSAQKVQKVYPEIVSEAKDGHLTVDYSKLSIVALKAIDLLNEKIERLEAEIKELKSKS